MRNKISALAFVLAVTACGGSTSGGSDGSLPEAQAGASAEPSDDTASADISSAGACALLSAAEIESAVSKQVVSAYNVDGDGIAGNCTWEFELIEEGPFAGDTPQLLLSAFEGSEYYDQLLLEYPDSPIDDIGSGALRRTDGDLAFLANSNTGLITSFLLFENGPQSNEAVEVLARLIADRLK